MRINVYGALGCALLLSGCLADESRCRGYGFEQGTPQFSQCLMQINQTRSQALIAGGQQLMIAGQAPPPAAPPAYPGHPPGTQMVCTPAYGGRLICQ